MTLIIDISEEEMKYPANIIQAVKHGIPLPKGHGRLIDANDLLDHTCIDEIPTIIEAESEE